MAYSAEVRARAIAGIASGRSAADVAREIGNGINEDTIRKWAKLAHVQKGAATPDTREVTLPSRLRAFAGDLDGMSTMGEYAALCRLAAEALENRVPDEDVTGEDLKGHARRTLSALSANARKSLATGNHTAAQRSLSAIGKLINDLARIESREGADDDVITVSRRDLEAAEVDYSELVRKTLERGLLMCARCGADVARELSDSKVPSTTPSR